MKDYKLILMSFVLLIFMVGAVSAANEDNLLANEINVDDSASISDDFVVGDSTKNTKDIFVNDTGDDSNSGSAQSPYSSINKAVSDVNDSDITNIYLSEGTFGKDNDTSFNFDFNHKSNGGNLNIIGAGADKTIIDGQSAFKFATIRENSIVTVKDITFVNFKSTNGAVFFNNGGILTIENCIFKDSYSTSSNGGVIRVRGNNANLTVKNSEFDSCYVTYSNGGAIYADNINDLYLENNIFVNITVGSGNGVAVYSSNANTRIINNKFINLTGSSSDASVFVNPVQGSGKMSYFINNTFINCANPSNSGSIVALSYGFHVSENNTFINSSNGNGNIYANGFISNLKFNVDNVVINVGNTEINKGVNIPINNITDDNGNIVRTSAYQIKLIGETTNYTYNPNRNGNNVSIIFSQVPNNGIYNLSISYYQGQLFTDVLATVNISSSNGPVELYVSPKGSDANNGTKEYPFETIQYAIDVGFEKTFNVIVHLLEGTYSGEGNVELTIANKGTLQIIGENYNKTIINGNNANWFLSVSTTNVNISNVNFVNGKSTSRNLISASSSYSLYLDNCIVDNNTLASTSYYILSNVHYNNLTYTNNNGRIYFGGYGVSVTLSDSYYANNIYEDLNEGGIILVSNDQVIFENSNFINNTATRAGVINAQSGFTSKNNYYANNRASQKYIERNSPASDNGVIYTTASKFTSENDIFINNSAVNCGVIGWAYNNNEASRSPDYNFTNCKFINNSASKEAGVTKIKAGTFTNCEFINNTATYGGAISLLPFVKDSYTLKLNNVTFNGNIADLKGNDIYLAEKNNLYYGDDFIYAIDLTIDFNDLNTSSLVDNIFANVTAPCDAQVSGSYITFLLDGNKIGSAEIVNGIATLNYAGFDDGQYNLSGSMYYQNENTIVNNATVNVKLEGIIDNVEFWVSVNGSDENGNGSESNPFKSISHAVDEAVKNCRNIVINIGEGTFTGEFNTVLTLSSLNNLTLKGAGIDKTILDGENATYLAKITNGNNLVVISDLTIQNMLPDNRVSRIIDINNPITVEEGANLLLNSVKITNAHGGEAVIKNDGNLYVQDSIFTKNGYTNNGLVSGGNVTIDNTSIVDNFQEVGVISADNIIINNSEIKNAFNYDTSSWAGGFYSVILGENLIIENTLISNDGDNSSLVEFGYDETNAIVPAVAIENYNVIMNNVSMINNYGSPTNVREMPSTQQTTYLSAFGYVYGWYPKNLTVSNSSFENYKYLWVVNTYYPTNFAFDGCYFNNLTYIAYSLTIEKSSSFSFNNSAFMDVGQAIDRTNYAHRLNPVIDFNNNYWGSNNQPVIEYLNNGQSILQNIPETWIILKSEDEINVTKHITDGENITDYNGNVPIHVDYADNDGALDYAVVIGDKGYLFTTDDDENVIFNVSEPIYPFIPADPMNYRTPSTIVITGFTGDLGVTGILVDPVGNPIANATITSTFEALVPVNVTTDENGAFTVKGGKDGILNIVFAGDDNYFDAEYNMTFTNAGKTTKSFINIDTIESDFIVKGSLVDDEGNPIANANITYTVNGENATVVSTDENGVFQIQGASDAVLDIAFEGAPEADAVNYTFTIKGLAPARLASEVVAENFEQYACDYYEGERGGNFTFKVVDAEGNALVNKTVYIGYNGVTLNRTTDENGFANVQINLKNAGLYTFVVVFLGDENFNASMGVYSVKVNKKPITISAAAKSYKASAKTKKFTVTLKTTKGSSADGKTYLAKGKKVSLTVNGKTYTAKTNAKGQATFALKLTKKGKFTASIKYDGDNTYNAASKSAKITIK